MTRAYDPSPTKTCPICGNTHTRRTLPNGRPENMSVYGVRTYCTPKCAHQASANNNKNHAPHAPCTICGQPVPKRPNESDWAWRARMTCSETCLIEGRREAARKANRKRAKKPTEEQLARKRERHRGYRAAKRQQKRARAQAAVPDRRVAFDRFPEPEGASTWVTVAGESLPVFARDNAVTTPPARPAILRAALHAHPDLARALAGDLTDSWVPHSGRASLPADLGQA